MTQRTLRRRTLISLAALTSATLACSKAERPPHAGGAATDVATAASGTVAVSTAAVATSRPDAARPIVIAHRGASGLCPEHTLAAYALAIEQGADFIEPDLVLTADGVLVARHENEIGGTTDVADRAEFAGRRTTKRIDGVPVTGWFVEDFTVAELKTLRARERIPRTRPGNAAYDGQFEIPTLQEIIDLGKREGTRRGRPVGLYPETKHPSYFAALGQPLEEPLVALLHAAGFRGRDAPAFIQSFEIANLRTLAGLTDLPLVQLLNDAGRPFDFAARGDTRTYADLATAAGLAAIAGYARGIGPAKALLRPRRADGTLVGPTPLVGLAHEAGLLVHPWTFRDEDEFLPADLRGQPAAEYAAFYALGVDGVFSDHPASAVAARDRR